MGNRFWETIRQLEDAEYKTAAELAKMIGVSEKTVRNLIKEINAVIREHGAEIEAKQKYGYHLEIRDETLWIDFLSRSRKNSGMEVPHNANERMYYLINYLLFHKDYVKIAELSEQIYISAQTLSAVIRRVEEALLQFHIQIERRPYYGVRAKGLEFDMRCCLIRYFSMDRGMFSRSFPVSEEELSRVFDILMEILPLHQIRLTELSLQNLAIYLFLSRMRIQMGFLIEELPAGTAEIYSKREYQAAQSVWRVLAAGAKACISDAELCYTAIYIAGKRNAGSSYKTNFIITEKTDRLAVKMLESIYSTFQVEVRDNLNLRMMLNQHLLPLDIRMRYGIPVDNPILQDIKREYVMAYTMACQAASVLCEHYGRDISDNEIGWLALIFQMAVENKNMTVRLNVLIVCASGKASSQLLLSKFRREFGEYIGSIDICTIFELKTRNLADADYIFTTVTIPFSVDVPILEIHDFIQHYELKSIKNVFQKQGMRFLHEFYQEDFFFTQMEGSTWEEVLTNLCQKISLRTQLPENFLEAVKKRERLGATDYGNLIAIPHPYEIVTSRNLVAAAVLKEPVMWNTNLVQIVILVSFSSEENPDIPRFYNVTTRFMTSEAAVRALLREPGYEKFMELLYEMSCYEPAPGT